MLEGIKKSYFYKKIPFLIFFCSFFLFIGKWIFSYYFFDENIGIRVIFENSLDGYWYFPFIKSLSLLDFNNSYDPNITNLKNIPFPLYGVLFHSIFFKIFGNFTFIILELICIFLFLIIFYNIFTKFHFSKLFSILFSILLFLIPVLLKLTNLENFNYLSILSQFYNLKFQHPLIVNLFLFYFILFLFEINDKKIFKIKNFVILGFILAFSFTSFYYHFVIESISFLFFLIYKSKFNFNFLLKSNIKYYFISLVTFLILSLPFIINIFYSEVDYGERMGIMDLTLSRKKILINHIFNGLFKIQFLVVFLLVSFLTYFVNKKKYSNYSLNNIVYIIFLSSILSPFIFLFFSPKLSLVYHFTDLIKIFAFISILFLFINIVKNYFNKYFEDKETNKSFLIFVIIFLIIFFNINTFYSYKSKFQNKDYNAYRSYLASTTAQIQEFQLQKKNVSLLTMDSRLMVWAIMNDIKNIKLISGQLVPKKHSMIEDDLISVFKFLDKSEDEFINFFANEKKDWRYLNNNTQIFFWLKYSANSLKTHNGSKEFDEDTLNFILNTSPLYAQSLAIPNNEFDRLRLKFRNYEQINFENPSIISINNKDILLKNLEVLNKNYCLDQTYSPFLLYKLKDDKIIC